VSATTDQDIYSATSDAQPGLLREVLQGFAKLHGLEVETQVSTTEKRVGQLIGGEADVVPMTATQQDAARLTFSREVFPKTYLVVTRKPRGPVRSAEDLKAEKFGVYGRNRGAVLANLGLPFTEVTSDPEALEQLRQGSLTATVLSFANALSARREDPSLQLGMFVGRRVSHVFGLRKEDTALLGALNEYVANMRRSGAWQRLVVEYFGDDAIQILKSSRSAEP